MSDRNRKSKPKAEKSRPTPHNRPQRRQPSPKQALMRIPAPPAQSWSLTLDEVALVRNHIAKGSTDEELRFCLAVARRRKLDPFKGQIWFVKRRDKTAEGGTRWIPITSIDGLCHIAARDHKDYGSNDDPEFGPMKEVRWTYFEKSGKFMAPEWARVTLWKKGHDHPTVATVYWDEIYPDAGASPMVREKPRLMLGKCALAQAVRRAYPATGGLYISEEFQGPPEFTPGGRVMTVEQPVDPAEQRYLEREQDELKKLSPAQREVLEKKMAEAKARQNPQPSETAAAGADDRAGEKTGDAGTAPANYDGLTCTLANGMYQIDGPTSRLHEVRDVLRPFWMSHAKPPGIFCRPEELGKLMRRFEEASVRFRIL